MGIDFFSELNAINRAHCAAHGFTSAELYGTEPNESELETHRLIAVGVPSESAGMFAPDRIAAHALNLRKTRVRHIRDIRLRNRNYAPGGFAEFVNRERRIAKGAA